MIKIDDQIYNVIIQCKCYSTKDSLSTTLPQSIDGLLNIFKEFIRIIVVLNENSINI